jgi:hypothetical protein
MEENEYNGAMINKIVMRQIPNDDENLNNYVLPPSKELDNPTLCRGDIERQTQEINPS